MKINYLKYLSLMTLTAIVITMLPFQSALAITTAKSTLETPSLSSNDLGALVAEQMDPKAFEITKNADGTIKIPSPVQSIEGALSTKGLSITTQSSDQKLQSTFAITPQTLSRAAQTSTKISESGKIQYSQQPTLNRGVITEKYQTSADGIRQDFIVSEKPKGKGELTLNLKVTGAKVTQNSDESIQLQTENGRTFAYHKLYVTDSTKKEIPAHFEIADQNTININVDDRNAVYPLTIDPTVTDDNWVGIGVGQAAPNGVGGAAVALAVDSNGDIYVGGSFTSPANSIARWDGEQWNPLGTYTVNGVNANNGGIGSVFAMAIDSEDNLYVAGSFTSASGVSANSVAQWDGSAWSALGTGVNSTVRAMALDPVTGDLYVGGAFTTAGGSTANRVARWDGSAWSSVGVDAENGLNNEVRAITFDPAGNLYVSGSFTTAGSVSATRVAMWDGAAWNALGAGLSGGRGADGRIYALVYDEETDELYAGGNFTLADGNSANYVAKWDGADWFALGDGLTSEFSPTFTVVRALLIDQENRTLYVGGGFDEADGESVQRVAQWDLEGETWSALLDVENDANGVGAGTVFALALKDNDQLYMGGSFTSIVDGEGGTFMSRTDANNVAIWDISEETYSSVGDGVNAYINSIVVDPNSDDVYIAGRFTHAGGVLVNNIAKWDPNEAEWSALGDGIGNGTPGEEVQAMVIDSQDNLYVGGNFVEVGGEDVNFIAKWNIIDEEWSALIDGDEVSGLDNSPYSLAIDPENDNLYVGGFFTAAGSTVVSNIAMWDGSVWSDLGGGMTWDEEPFSNVVYAVIVNPDNGDLYAAGSFTEAGETAVNNIARWDGVEWSALADGLTLEFFPFVRALALNSDNTELYAGGSFTSSGETETSYIAKWDLVGETWSDIGGGMDNVVRVIAVDYDNNILAGGDFIHAGETLARYVAKWDPELEEWSALGSGMNNSAYTLAIGSDNNLYVGGKFTVAGDGAAEFFAQCEDCAVAGITVISLGVADEFETTLGVEGFATYAFTDTPEDTHTVTLLSIEDSVATLLIESDPVEVSLGEGESENIDTDGNGVDDTTIEMGEVGEDEVTFRILSYTPPASSGGGGSVFLGGLNNGSSNGTTDSDNNDGSSSTDRIFPDTDGHWAEAEIKVMAKAGIITGGADGKFRPDDSLNRAEAAALLYRIMTDDAVSAPSTKPFTDVNIDTWYVGYISTLKMHELVNGNPDGTYRPGNTMNRAEFFTLAMNLYYHTASEEDQAEIDELKTGQKTTRYSDLADAWYTPVVTAATELGFAQGSTCGTGKCFNAESNITRAEAAVILSRMFK